MIEYSELGSILTIIGIFFTILLVFGVFIHMAISFIKSKSMSDFICLCSILSLLFLALAYLVIYYKVSI